MPDPAPVHEMPSSRHLVRSTVIALVVAAVLLVTVVMPAEYGVDPTGVGRVLGLTSMGEIKVSLEEEVAEVGRVAEPAATASPQPRTDAPALPAAAITTAASAPDASTSTAGPSDAPPVLPDAPMSTHVTQVVLAPGEGKEIKLVMRKGARVTFSWSTDRGAVNYDLHADAPGIDYHPYTKGSGKPSDEGVLVAAFDGSHGWFWRNRGKETVTVTLTTDGDYQELKRM